MPAYPKSPHYESRPLRQLIATLECVRCGIEGYTQCAHMGGVAQGKGLGYKVSDSRCAALCGPHPNAEGEIVVGCHAEVGEGHGDHGLEWIARTFILLVERGLLVVKRR
jgi:hypothetical protein